MLKLLVLAVAGVLSMGYSESVVPPEVTAEVFSVEREGPNLVIQVRSPNELKNVSVKVEGEKPIPVERKNCCSITYYRFDVATPHDSGTLIATVCIGDSCKFVRLPFAVAGASIYYQLAIAGLVGLLMNFMPCVLPTVGLKLLSFAKHGGRSGYVVGVVLSFMALATVSVFVGAGFSHMSVWVVRAVIAAICLLMGTHLLGLWHMPAIGLGRWSGTSSSFGLGIMTVVLGSSCSVPFLAPVLVYCATSGAVVTYLTFLIMAIGFCTPFLLPIHRFMPRPGQWMVYFERGCGVVMLVVAAWLGSTLFGGTTDTIDIPQDRPVAVIATADWCVNCGVVHGVFNDPEVVAALKATGTEKIVLDWTNGNADITEFLREKSGQASVPFLFIRDRLGRETVLTGIYTKAQVLDALEDDQ